MRRLIGLRKEDKNIWEKRVPVIPEHVKRLNDKFGIDFIVQEFPERTYKREEFISAGATVSDDISECPFIFAVKEVPINLIKNDKVYMFFSHTIKGQDYNMPLLQKIIESKSTLIDYETITDDLGKRLVFFGHFAGVAGMIETLNGLGIRLKRKGFDTPFLKIKQAYQYTDKEEAKKEIEEVAKEIETIGLPDEILPLNFGFAGYGNVSLGAQEIFDLLPHNILTPNELDSVSNQSINKIVFKEEDLVETQNTDDNFELLDYYNNPEKYKSKFEKYLVNLDVLINAIYWTESYPRLVTKEFLKSSAKKSKLDIICDISCDINGSVEITEKVTEPDVPAFVYNPETDEIIDGYDADGTVDIAVDNLPAELPKDASNNFSEALLPFIPGIVNADYDKSFEQIDLPPEIKRAVIVYKGELTPNYEYLKDFLNAAIS